MVPYYQYNIMGPKNPVLIIKAPTLLHQVRVEGVKIVIGLGFKGLGLRAHYSL